MPRGVRFVWNRERTVLLIEMRTRRVGVRECAQVLGTSNSTIVAKIRRLEACELLPSGIFAGRWSRKKKVDRVLPGE